MVSPLVCTAPGYSPGGLGPLRPAPWCVDPFVVPLGAASVCGSFCGPRWGWFSVEGGDQIWSPSCAAVGGVILLWSPRSGSIEIPEEVRR